MIPDLERRWRQRGGWRLALALLAGGVGATPLAGAQEAPQRLVSLVPAATQVLFAIGAGDRLVGVSSYDTWPEEVGRLPRVGALLDPNLEVILALRPDLVVVDPAQAALERQLASAGIDSYVYATEDIAGILTHMHELGSRLGLADAGTRAASRLRSELAQVRSAVRGNETVATVLVFGRRPGGFAELWVNGGVGFLHELVEVAGGRNLYADMERQSARAGLEVLLARVPEVLVELRLGSDLADLDTEAIAAEWHALPGYAAVRVTVLTDSWLVTPGSRVAEAARLFADAIRR